MKGFKATYNMKCRNQTYKVGKTYTSDKLQICRHGIHFCKKMKDVIEYYKPTKNFVLLEVEAIGKVITDGDKSVTDKIKILRIVPPEEYNFKIYTHEYDDKGNMISTTYPDGKKDTYEYDDKGNVISNTSLSGHKITYEYDDKGNMISDTYPSGRKRVYEYDDRGNMIFMTYISDTYPDGEKHTYEYDEKSNVISHTYPDGEKFSYEYNTLMESD